MTVLSSDTIREAIDQSSAGVFGSEVHYHDQVESTNDILRELAEQGSPEGTLVIADEQVKGRGRMGRVWIAPPGTSLLMSILFRPTLAPIEAHRLVMVAGLAAAEASESVAGVRVDVKWPNDLQISGKKLAGILPESVIEGSLLKWVIIGMGMNVNQGFPPDDPLAHQATSLAAAVGQPVDRLALLGRIMSGVNYWNTRINSAGLAESWRNRCVTLGSRVHIAVPGNSLVGLAEDIDDNGALWLQTDDGERHHLTLGEATTAG
jgi:BirA family transcriptional regulator, biotin operon repressor / biotin---[acetyl-CoA-carboxylase] ligase